MAHGPVADSVVRGLAADSAAPPGGPAGRGGREFGPPAPPKGKGPKKNAYQQKERGPKGPIPTKFTGRMYDLDDVEKDDSVTDELPEFMKPDDVKPEDAVDDTPEPGDADRGPDLGEDDEDDGGGNR